MASYYKNAKVDLTSTDVTTLYTAPAATTAIFKSIIVADDSGSTSTITLTLTDSASAVFVVYNVKATVANGTAELLTQPLVVQESEILKVTAANANRLHVIGSYLEIS
jgi:3-hydroxymyristoyl/3-hydroxydecanoyl-(acyl carrier protein) dehydratase|tara:strand:- start:4 stop:327 length:324 start_codon:yes stop_codon:yes gene_type:complete